MERKIVMKSLILRLFFTLLIGVTCIGNQNHSDNCPDGKVVHSVWQRSSNKCVPRCFRIQRIGEGLMTVIDEESDNIDTVSCPPDKYQPESYLSNKQCGCAFTKSKCYGEGQKIASDGNTTTDRACYCNYINGFMYSQPPRNKARCYPRDENCNCEPIQCANGTILKGRDHIYFVILPDNLCVDFKHTNGTTMDYPQTNPVQTHDSTEVYETTKITREHDKSSCNSNISIPTFVVVTCSVLGIGIAIGIGIGTRSGKKKFWAKLYGCFGYYREVPQANLDNNDNENNSTVVPQANLDDHDNNRTEDNDTSGKVENKTKRQKRVVYIDNEESPTPERSSIPAESFHMSEKKIQKRKLTGLPPRNDTEEQTEVDIHSV